jgi:hypothetical protein
MLALPLAACGPAAVCEDYVGKKVEAEESSGTATLSAAGDSVAQRFRVSIRGLPELWGNSSPITEALVMTNLVERYAEGDPGGDGATQMPRLMVAFGAEPPSISQATPPYFPGPMPEVLGGQLVDCYADAGNPCCQYGSTGCEFVSTLFVTRTEGEPFPPVTVSWTASASLRVAQCPVASSPELELIPEDEP